MIFKNNINMMTKEEMLKVEIDEFRQSKAYKLMLDGKKYYDCDNTEINSREMKRQTEEGVILDLNKPNNKLAHGFLKNLIDEKVGYLLSKEPTLTCDNENYLNSVKEALGKYFYYKFMILGENSSKYGVAWLHPYIDQKGEFELKVIPSEQCIPIWRDDEHIDLEGLLRVYPIVTFEGKQKKVVDKVVYYNEKDIRYYELTDEQGYKRLISDIGRNGGKSQAHYTKNDKPMSWGKTPFIAFKNNHSELPDIKFVKTLIDAYDKSRSNISNYLDEVNNLIYVLKGYGGTNKEEFLRDLNYFRLLLLDEDGEAGTLNPKVDIEAAKQHFEQLKRDIVEFGQSYSKDLDKFGSAPSGVALEIMFKGLDLKCNKMEAEFKVAFDQLMYFVNIYLGLSETNLEKSDIEITFNRSTPKDEMARINACTASKGVVSDETLLKNHPWVTDVEEELKLLQEQLKEAEKLFGNYEKPNGENEDIKKKE